VTEFGASRRREGLEALTEGSLHLVEDHVRRVVGRDDPCIRAMYAPEK
jgi:hypothetical protein